MTLTEVDGNITSIYSTHLQTAYFATAISLIGHKESLAVYKILSGHDIADSSGIDITSATGTGSNKPFDVF